ncbi:hypothetical protein FISHEDRAFT_66954 [Fistulina hepatica ATCC 64428]|uniref:Uncharacterized protein n=1 Tax=Fistulina hepatica ATCC 64428 TaxID=1128425 RepID=A0A0D7A2Z7_9AGAR|nr:hypothetical protein FISHEDRAFT_66954 [Fistulina hepatica ATCC 64428]
MMFLLRSSMESTSGGYVTPHLHVPQEVWSQGGAKLNNLAEKNRAISIIANAMKELQNGSSEIFGPGNVCSGFGMGIGSIGPKEVDAWMAKLDEFSGACDAVVSSFGKKLSVGEGFAVKKNKWGDKWSEKMTRKFDKLNFTGAGKNLDSPSEYVMGLRGLFKDAQLLDEHTRAVLMHNTTSSLYNPVQAPSSSYHAFPMDYRVAVEARLKRSSEFFASVLLTFVVRDLSLLLDKYVKKCEKWLAE